MDIGVRELRDNLSRHLAHVDRSGSEPFPIPLWRPGR